MPIHKIQHGLHFLTPHWPLIAGKPVVLFIHGAGFRAEFWKSQIEGLSADQSNGAASEGCCQPLAIDLPGHGGSPGNFQTEIDAYAGSVRDFVQTGDFGQPYLCGHSMGGAVAMQLLADAGELFAGGILVCTGAKLKVAPQIFESLQYRPSEYLEMITNFGIFNTTHQSRLKVRLAEALESSPNAALADFTACNNFNLMERLAHIRKPVLVVTGAGDLLTPPHYGRYLAANIPGAAIYEIPDTGHLLPMESPQDLNAAIRRFLAPA